MGRTGIGYIVHEYPSWTQTFSGRQISELLEQGLDVLPIASKPGPTVPPEAGLTTPPSVQILPKLISRQTLGAQLTCLVSRPLAYLRLVFATGSAVLTGSGGPRWLPVADLLRGAALARLLQRQLPDVLHLHGEFAGSEASIALVAATLARRSFSFSSHSSQYEPLMRPKLRTAAWITPTSLYEASRLTWRHGADPAKLRLLYMGVPRSRTRGAPAERSASDSFTILSVGSLQEKKGHEYLIRAVACLLTQGIPVRCTIVGGGPLDESLGRLVRGLGLTEQVSLLGWMPSGDVAALSLKADVFCLACVTSPVSGTDGIPFALMEAMQLGVPCVSTWTAGIPELIWPDVTGLLVPPADASALADALKRLASDHELRRRIGQEGARHVAERFDLSVNMAKLAELLRSSTTSPSRRRASALLNRG